MRKRTITMKQAEQFNRMRATLIKINKHYMTPAQIRRDSEKNTIGLDFEEYIEMSYENIQGEARSAVHGIRALNIEQNDNPPTSTGTPAA